MNYVEEQKNELEALSEIYYNEIQVKSNQPPISFSIHIRPQASCFDELEAHGNDNDNEDTDDNDDLPVEKPVPPSVELLFKLPETYPDIKPSIQPLDYTNLDETEIDELLSDVDKKAEDSLGSVMIFMLVSDIVEWLSSRAEREAIELEREKNRKIEALEAEEKRKAEGTPVTVETFLAWKEKFDADLLKAEIEQQKKQIEQNPSVQRKLTGREMFEKDKALAESDLNFVDDLEQEQIDALLQNIDDLDLEAGDDEEFELDTDDDGDSDNELSNSDDD